jgi:hypothetical protein
VKEESYDAAVTRVYCCISLHSDTFVIRYLVKNLVHLRRMTNWNLQKAIKELPYVLKCSAKNERGDQYGKKLTSIGWLLERASSLRASMRVFGTNWSQMWYIGNSASVVRFSMKLAKP